MMSMTMKQPVRPAPALQRQTQKSCPKTDDARVHINHMIHKVYKRLHVFLYLQWTTIGPADGGLEILTLRMKESSPVAWYGTPWSGQPVKWNCLTSRTSLKPRWAQTKDTFLLHSMVPVKLTFHCVCSLTECDSDILTSTENQVSSFHIFYEWLCKTWAVTHPLQCKCANHIFSQRFDLHKRHLEVSVHLRIIWPILIALHLFKKNELIFNQTLKRLD